MSLEAELSRPEVSANRNDPTLLIEVATQLINNGRMDLAVGFGHGGRQMSMLAIWAESRSVPGSK